MKKFHIIAISESWLFGVHIALMVLMTISMIVLITAKIINSVNIISVLIVISLLFIYFKKYFVYSIVLELYENKLKVLKNNREEEILFFDIKSYKVEMSDGIKVIIRLENHKKIKIIASNSFGSSSEVLKDFYINFEELIKEHQKKLSINIEREKSFFEIDFWFYLVTIISVVGFISVVIVIFTKGFSVVMFVIIVPILLLLPAVLETRGKK